MRLLVVLVAACAAPKAPAQDSLGAAVRVWASVDAVSRFVARGLEVAPTPQVQPSLAVSVGRATVGAWGSSSLAFQGTDPDGAPPYEEAVLWGEVVLDVPGGTLTPHLRNVYNPRGARLFDLRGGGDGAHLLQVQLRYAAAPFDAAAHYFFYNEPHRTLYLEGGWRPLAGRPLRLFAGGTPRATPIADAARPGLTAMGVEADFVVSATPGADLAVLFRALANPTSQRAFVVAGLRIGAGTARPPHPNVAHP